MNNNKCLNCGGELPPPSKHSRNDARKYCSWECRDAYYKKKYHLFNPYKGTSSGTTGAISELRVAVDLLSKGFNVFRSLSPNSPCDLAVLKNGRLRRIEVRTTFLGTSGKPNSAVNKKDDLSNIDHYAFVTPEKIIYEPEIKGEDR
uniref:Uncharacterized protein n=1 Tax=viral metagenome TaxID=1070528 RepID=A0A6M3IQ58_9ZZZZ